MIRILIFLTIVFSLGLGFAWLADRPGDMVVTFSGYQYQVSLMVAAVAVTAIVAAVMITWWLVKSIWNSPYTIARYFRVRQRDRGYQALSTGMIAAGAGDAALARKMNKQAAKLIRSETEPLINLLDAQASLLEGDHKSAREKFERMLDDPEMRLLGLRGLYLEAERLGDRSAARHYAGRAADIAPQLGWALDSTLEEKTAAGDWDGALKLVDAQKSAGGVEKDVVNRRRAVLLTAKAEDLLDTDLASAKAAAIEANRLAPHFAPAAVVAAKALFRQNDVRKGSKILEAAWKAEPHPAVSDLYIHARPGDAVLDRLARARKLEQLRSNNVETSLALARAALDAHEFKLAREAAEAAVRMQPREGGYLLLADIEEAETGDQGRVRQFLARAVRAQRDPAWVADGFVSERWAPVSPVTGKLDAFEWRVPVERLGPVIEQDMPQHPSLALPSAAEDEAVDATILDEVDTTVAGPLEIVEEKVETKPEATEARPAEQVVAEPVDVSEPAEPVRLPDDPGVEPEQEQEKSERRFRLFQIMRDRMFDRIIAFLKDLPAGDSNAAHLGPDDPRVAAAALMYHVMDADGVRQDAEWERMKQLLSEAYGLTGAALDELVVAGGEADEEAVDLYAFTSVLARHLDAAQRVEFIGLMWEVAYADGELHELEDNTLWRVAELLGVDSRARILERQKAKAEAVKLTEKSLDD